MSVMTPTDVFDRGKNNGDADSFNRGNDNGGGANGNKTVNKLWSF